MANDNIQANSEKKVVIELDNVRRDFLVGEETVHALKGVSFKIYEGEFVTIMGKSGSGKSTLLNQLGCLDTPSSGEYYLDGVSVRKCHVMIAPFLGTERLDSSSRTTIFYRRLQV